MRSVVVVAADMEMVFLRELLIAESRDWGLQGYMDRLSLSLFVSKLPRPPSLSAHLLRTAHPPNAMFNHSASPHVTTLGMFIASPQRTCVSLDPALPC